jgi:hypothetical protein
MPEQWLSVAEAAASMKVHPRTIERRIAAGKIQTKKSDDGQGGQGGQVQVLVTVPDTVEPVSSEAFETVKTLANQQVDIAAGSASAIVRVAQEQAMRAENQLLLARQDAGRYRKEMQMAMGLVACILLMVILAVGWCTRTITNAQSDARRASDKAVLASDNAVKAVETAKSAQSALDEERERANTAIIAKAKAEGELAAYKTELSGVVQLTQKKPTSQPSTFVGRMTQAFIGD